MAKLCKICGEIMTFKPANGICNGCFKTIFVDKTIECPSISIGVGE